MKWLFLGLNAAIFYALGFYTRDLADGSALTSFWEIGTGAIVTLAATYFGALAAFRLEQTRQDHAHDSANIAAANLAVFEIVRSMNSLVAVRKAGIDEFRESPGRHFLIKPVFQGIVTPPALNFQELEFVFSLEPSFLGELSIVVMDVSSTIEVLRARNELHSQFVQPALEAITLRNGLETVTGRELEAEIGPLRTHTLKDYTDALIEGIDTGIDKLDEYARKLSDVVKRKHPSRAVISLRRAQVKPPSGKQDVRSAAERE